MLIGYDHENLARLMLNTVNLYQTPDFQILKHRITCQKSSTARPFSILQFAKKIPTVIGSLYSISYMTSSAS